MKFLLVLAFAVVAALCIAISQGVSSKYGTKGMHDRLLHRFYCLEDSSWWHGVSCDIEYPPKGYVNENTISAIYAIDQSGGKSPASGYASLYEGGPGFKNMKTHIKAPRGTGLNFTVDLYAFVL